MAPNVKTARAYNATLRQELAQVTRQRILDAARRLLVEGIYSTVTMHDIAREAGVAYQTLYAVFRSKLLLADAIIAADWPHIARALQLLDNVRDAPDPESWFGTLATMSRRIYEPCADLMRFLRESGDADLLGRYRQVEGGRHAQLEPLRGLLEQSPRLQPGVTAAEAVDLVWSLTGPNQYIELVFERGWTPDRYEAWLSGALRALVLGSEAGAGTR